MGFPGSELGHGVAAGGAGVVASSAACDDVSDLADCERGNGPGEVGQEELLDEDGGFHLEKGAAGGAGWDGGVENGSVPADELDVRWGGWEGGCGFAHWMNAGLTDLVRPRGNAVHGVGGMVYTVGNEQDYHFKVLKEIFRKLGRPWADGL